MSTTFHKSEESKSFKYSITHNSICTPWSLIQFLPLDSYLEFLWMMNLNK